jgi:hypothetical protein
MIRAISGSNEGRVLSAGLAAVLIAAGSAAAAVKPYRVPKERESAPQASASSPAPAREGVAWVAPSGWQEVPPGQMRLGSFKVKGPDDAAADVSIIPLPGMAGGTFENVNRWRAQVGLAPVKPEELAGLAENLEISGGPAQLYDMAGQPSGAKAKARILAAIQSREGTVFFYKMTGDDKLVASQKANFVSFLQSVKFGPGVEGGMPPSHRSMGEGAGMAAGLPPSHPPLGGLSTAKASGQPDLPPSHPPLGDAGLQPGLPPSHPPLAGLGTSADTPAAQAKLAWKVPAGWLEQPPGPMQFAKFLASGKAGAKAEVSVAIIPGNGGGPLANVNRWRGQIGLGPITQSALSSETSSLEVAGATALVLDATSSDKAKRLVVVSVPLQGDTWFYKLMGDEPAVAKEKEAFVAFVKSAK